MNTICTIKSSKDAFYPLFEKWIMASFPKKEYRELAEMRALIDDEPAFNIDFLIDNSPVGAISYWRFDKFVYIEHLVIAPSCRSKGYGGRLLELLIDKANAPIVLEVEIPREVESRARVSFYQFHQFKLWKSPYKQPPYRKGGNAFRMKIMSRGALTEADDFEMIRDTIYNNVYKTSADELKK